MQQRGTASALAALALSVGCALPGMGGTSVLCGDAPQIAFYYANYVGPRSPAGEAKKVWSGSRSVVLGERIGIQGTDIRDVRIVGLTPSTGMRVGGAVSENGNGPLGGRASVPRGDPTGGQWRLDVSLSNDAAATLSAVSEEIAGSYNVVALVVGGEVFSASVDLPIRFGVARIGFPSGRGQDSGRRFFRDQLGCVPEGK